MIDRHSAHPCNPACKGGANADRLKRGRRRSCRGRDARIRQGQTAVPVFEGGMDAVEQPYDAGEPVDERRCAAQAGLARIPRPFQRKRRLLRPTADRREGLRRDYAWQMCAHRLPRAGQGARLLADLSQETKGVLVVAKPDVQPMLDNPPLCVPSACALSAEPPPHLIDDHALASAPPGLRQLVGRGKPGHAAADDRNGSGRGKGRYGRNSILRSRADRRSRARSWSAPCDSKIRSALLRRSIRSTSPCRPCSPSSKQASPCT